MGTQKINNIYKLSATKNREMKQSMMIIVYKFTRLVSLKINAPFRINARSI